jgi:hypothetical protein
MPEAADFVTTESSSQPPLPSPSSLPVSNPTVSTVFDCLRYILAHKSTTQDSEVPAPTSSYFVTFLCSTSKQQSHFHGHE